MPLILGIVGGVLLLCGGGCAGVWFLGIEPAAKKRPEELDRQAAEVRRWEDEVNKPPTTAPNQPGGVAGAVKPDEAAVMPAGDFLKLTDAQRRSYDKKRLQLTGPVQRVHRQSFPDKPPPTFGSIEVGPARGKTVHCHFAGDEWVNLPAFDDLKEYAVVGQVTVNGFDLTLTGCRVVGEVAPPPPNVGSLTFANAARVTPGMTLAEVEAVFGPGAAPTEGEVDAVALRLPNALEARPRWVAKHKSGHTLTWADALDRVVVAFSADPKSGGTVVGVAGHIGLKAVEVVKLPAAASGGTGPNPPAGDAIQVTAEDVTAEFDKDAKAADAKYKGRLLKVTGEVLSANDAGGTAGAVVFLKGATPTDKKRTALRVSAVFTGDAKAEALKVKAGDTVTFTGRVLRFKEEIANRDWTLQLVQPKLVK